MGLPDRIQQALEGASISPAEIARRLGIQPQAVTGWFKTGRISKENLAGVSRETGKSMEWLVTGNDGPPATAQDVPPYSGTFETAHVPVVGYVVATPGEDGYFEDMGYPAGGGDSYVAWPTRDKNAYAVRVRGDSMQPRIRPGEVIVVEPNRRASPGDDVVVRCRDGRKMVKQLLWKRGGEVTLGSINIAHAQMTLPEIDIESIHYVAAIVPRASAVDE